MLVKFALFLIVIFVPFATFGDDLHGFSELSRPDPFGKIVVPDQSSSETGNSKSVILRAARNSFVSFNLAVNLPDSGDYDLSLELSNPNKNIEIDLYKQWFHFNDADAKYYPDALIPIANPYRAVLPDAANQIKNQTAQSFWVDLWIAHDAKPGLYRGQAILKTKQKTSVTKIELRVLHPIIPDEDALIIDHNSYGGIVNLS